MDWISIILALISALAGGGLIGLLTIRETKKSMKIENAVKEDDRWSKLADELQDENAKLNDRLEKKDARITELEDTVSDLRTKLDDAKTAAVKASLLRCNRLNCERRSPPLGYTELTPEELEIEKRNLSLQ